jgi:hypothetical protein
LRYPAKVAVRKRRSGTNQHKDARADAARSGDYRDRTSRSYGRSLRADGPRRGASHESEFYLTECTWMRSTAGARRKGSSIVRAQETRLPFKPMVELYTSAPGPEVNHGTVARLRNPCHRGGVLKAGGMDAHINQREQETGPAQPDPPPGATGTGTRASARSRVRSRPTTPSTSATPTRPRSCRPNRVSRRLTTTPLRHTRLEAQSPRSQCYRERL